MSGAEMYVLMFERQMKREMSPSYLNATKENKERMDERIHAAAMREYRKIIDATHHGLSR